MASPGTGQPLKHVGALFVVIEGPQYRLKLTDYFLGGVNQIQFFSGSVNVIVSRGELHFCFLVPRALTPHAFRIHGDALRKLHNSHNCRGQT